MSINKILFIPIFLLLFSMSSFAQKLSEIAGKKWYCVKIHYGGPGEPKSTEILSEQNPTPYSLGEFYINDYGQVKERFTVKGNSIYEMSMKYEKGYSKLVMRYSSGDKYVYEFEILHLTEDVLDIIDDNKLHLVFVSDFKR